MKKIIFEILLFTSITVQVFAQSFQVVKGKVVDKSSKYPLLGVTVSIENEDGTITSTQTDVDGFYKLQQVSIGRKTIKYNYIGYQNLTQNEVMVTSAKEVVLNIELQESINELGEIQVNALGKEQTVNDMAIVSARSFTVEEADRYASSRQDPARMAGNFAGVNSTSDARNDIVVRGNSPLGLLWRLNEIDIPNPSHFAVAGSTGGPVSIINSKFLARSDFFTGAFPAEYGNANAGVFDLKMRNGNTERYEHSAQFGLLGTEVASEGPFKKGKKASYLATFRYSTLRLLQGINFQLGTDAVPNYLDYSFRINLPTQKLGTFSIFAIGGVSNIDIILSKSDERPKELYGEQNRDQYFKTSMGVMGIQNVYFFNQKTFLTSTLAQSYQNVNSNHFLIYRDSATYKMKSRAHITSNDQWEFQSSFNQSLTHKFSSRASMKAGYFLKVYNFSLVDSLRNDGTEKFITRANVNTTFGIFQPFVQFKYALNEKLTFHAGIHGQIATINQNSKSLEPRVGLNYKIGKKGLLSAGFGMHSQLQPLYFYYMTVPYNRNETVNRNVGFSRSIHNVISYDYVARQDLRFKIEAYYQYLYEIPVPVYSSGISMINQGATFSRFFAKSQMENKGDGYNYGMEFTVEKFFSKNYYLLWTTSIYQSKYRGSDKIWRNTDFNGNYITNLLAGYELPLNSKKTTMLVTGTKISFAGGRRYTPANADSSLKYKDYQFKEDSINAYQFKPYFRWDVRLGLRINAKKVTHEIMLDLVNVLNIRNPLALTYAPDPTKPNNPNPTVVNYQLGFLPIFYYKADF